MTKKTCRSKWSDKTFVQSLDPMNIPFRPVDQDGVNIKVKDMTPDQKSMYRKWLIAKKAGALV